MASMNSRYHPVGPPATSLSKVPHHPSTGGKSAISMRSGHSTSSSSAAAPAPPSSRRRSSTQDTRKTKQARTHVDDDASSAHYSHEEDPAGLADGFFDANDDAVEKEAAPVQLPGLEPFKQPAPVPAVEKPRAPVPKRSPHWKNSEFMPVVNFGDEIDARLQAVYVPERETFPFGEMEQLHKQINLMAMSVQGSRALHEYYTETSNDIEAKVKALLLRPSNAASNVHKFIQEFAARKTPSLGDIKIFATEIMARTAGAESVTLRVKSSEGYVFVSRPESD